MGPRLGLCLAQVDRDDLEPRMLQSRGRTGGKGGRRNGDGKVGK